MAMNPQPQRVLECSLWIGDLDATSTEEGIKAMFAAIGEPVKNVRILRDRNTGMCLGYGFISFDNDEAASGCLMRCNGKPVPGTNGARRFKLNYSKQLAQNPHDEHSAFVGELSDDVSDLDLFNVFKHRYPSVRWAKVMVDESGRARGFGFVRFGDESEFQRACVDMNGHILGSRAIRVSPSTSRKASSATGSRTTTSTGGTYGPQSPNAQSTAAYAEAYAQPAAYYGASTPYAGLAYGYGTSASHGYPTGYSAAEAYAYYAAQYANAQQQYTDPQVYATNVQTHSNTTAPASANVPADSPEPSANGVHHQNVPQGPGVDRLPGFVSVASAALADPNALVDPDVFYRSSFTDGSVCSWIQQHSAVALLDHLNATQLHSKDPVLSKRVDAELADYVTA